MTMARLTVVATLALFLASGAKEQPKDSKSEAKDTKIRELTAELEALKKQAGECQVKLVDESEDSYVTVEDIVDATGVVTQKLTGAVTEKLGVSSLDVSSIVKPYVEAAKQRCSSIDVSKVTEAVSSGYDAACKAVSGAASKLQEQHDQYVLPHAGEYYGAAKPHVASIQTAVYDTVNAQLPQLKDGLNAAHIEFKEKTKDLFEQITLKASAALAGTPSGILEKLYEKKEVSIMGWKKSFTHGYLDIALFFVQSIVNIYVLLLAANYAWKLVFGFTIRSAFKVTKVSVKASYGLTRTTTTLAFKLVFFSMSAIFALFMLAVMCALSLSAVHGIHTGAKTGMDPTLRLAVGLGVGALLFLPFYCCCCCRRSKPKTGSAEKSASGKNGKASSNGKESSNGNGKATSASQPAKSQASSQPSAKATTKKSTKK